jgi:bacillithiol biosynthesis deacetylase BshB1
MKLDILAFGVHPDDVELGCGGTIINAIAEGKKVGIIDLTQGELGTRGSIETRYVEAEAAAKVLGVSVRENLKMDDGFFKHDKKNVREVIRAIRKYQPEIILCNAPQDRHPDHGRSSKMVEEAAFLSGLRKIETKENGKSQPAWRPTYVFNYLQDRFLQPQFVLDISNCFEQKLEALLCYKTQFNSPDTNEPQTYISTPQFMETFKARALMLGKQIGVHYAEGFLSNKIIGLRSFDSFIQNVT